MTSPTSPLCVVLGAPRSGTTWLQRLLASSPHVASPQETHLFQLYLVPQRSAWDRQAARLATALTATRTAQLQEGRITGLPTIAPLHDLIDAQRVLITALIDRCLAEKPTARWVVEKSPSNSLCVDLIGELWPEVKFIHVVRHPADVIASLRDASRTWGARWAPSDPAAAAQTWVHHYRGARRAATHGKDRYVEVRYEDLRGDPARQLGRVFDFLGLDDDPGQTVAREHRQRGSLAETFVLTPELRRALSTPLVGGGEPIGFRSEGRAPLSRPWTRALQLEAADDARAAGYDVPVLRGRARRTGWRLWLLGAAQAGRVTRRLKAVRGRRAYASKPGGGSRGR